MATHVGTIAFSMAHFADDMLGKAVIALVLRKSKWERFNYFFKKVLQAG